MNSFFFGLALLATPPAALAAEAPSPLFDRLREPLAKDDAERLTKAGYILEGNGRVLKPKTAEPVEAMEMPRLLEELESQQRLEAMINLDLLFNKYGYKNIPSEPLAEVRRVGRQNWSVLPATIRADLKSYFSGAEIEAMDSGATPVRIPKTWLPDDDALEPEKPAAADERLPPAPAPRAPVALANTTLPAPLPPPWARPAPKSAGEKGPQSISVSTPAAISPAAPLAAFPVALPAPWAKPAVAVAAAPAAVPAAIPLPAAVAPAISVPVSIPAAVAPAAVPLPTPPIQLPVPAQAQPAAYQVQPAAPAQVQAVAPAQAQPAAAAPALPAAPAQPAPVPEAKAPAPPAVKAPEPAPRVPALAPFTEYSETTHEAFLKFLQDAPYGREVHELLELLSRRADPEDRVLAVGVVVRHIPAIIIDSSRAGARLASAVSLPEGDLGTGKAVLALHAGPAIVQQRHLLFSSDPTLLPEAPEFYKERGAEAPRLQAATPGAATTREEEGEWGRVRIYEDDSRKLKPSQEQLAGTLLAALLRLDARARGWSDAYHVALRERSAQLRFYRRFAELSGAAPHLDREMQSEYTEWLMRPWDWQDHWLQVLSSPIEQEALPSLSGGLEDRLAARAAAEDALLERAGVKVDRPRGAKQPSEDAVRENAARAEKESTVLAASGPEAQAWLGSERRLRRGLSDAH